MQIVREGSYPHDDGAQVDTGLDLIREAYRRYHALVLASCRRRLRDPQQAEDVTQEVFLRAWRGAHSFDPTRPLLPWLLTIARRTCWELDHPPPTTRLGDSEHRLAAERDGFSLDAVLENAEIRDNLESALSGLSPRYRRILLLKTEGWSLRDLAHADGSTTTSVAKVLARARARAKRRLEELGQGMTAILPTPGFARALTTRARDRLRELSGQTAVFVDAGAGFFASLIAGVVLAVTSLSGSVALAGDVAAEISRTSSEASTVWASAKSEAVTAVDARIHGKLLSNGNTSAAGRVKIWSRDIPSGAVGVELGNTIGIEVNEQHPNGVDPTGGHIFVGTYDSDGNEHTGAGMDFDCGNNNDLSPSITREQTESVKRSLPVYVTTSC